MLFNNYVKIIMPKRVGWLEVVVVVIIIIILIGVVMLIFAKLSVCVN